MTNIQDFAVELITITGQDVYSLLHLLRTLSTDNARAETRNMERHYAQKYAWKKSNVQYRQMQKKFIKHK